MISLLLALAAIQAAPAAPAADPVPNDRYRTCTTLVRTDPERAVGSASAWRLEGGGIPARQCLGLAYVALERWDAAANVYEDAARDADSAGDPRRADLWVQAGNAWLAAGQAQRGITLLDQALATPDLSEELRGEVHIDRARALVSLGNVAQARQDLDQALQLVPADPFGWYLSAALAQRQGDLVRAGADIDRALQLAPDDAQLVLLAGTIKGQAGDLAEAERLYRRVVELSPQGPAGRAAADSLSSIETDEASTPPAAPAPTPAPPAAPREPQSR